MDWVSVKSDWEYYRARVKARWGRLNAGHLDAIAGDRMRLAATISALYAIDDVEVEKQILYFEERNQSYRPESSSCSRWRSV